MLITVWITGLIYKQLYINRLPIRHKMYKKESNESFLFEQKP